IRRSIRGRLRRSPRRRRRYSAKGRTEVRLRGRRAPAAPMIIPGASFLAARTRSAPQGFGRPIPRKEDARLVTGRGRFSDDFNLPGQTYAHLVRSPHAHARVLSIDASAALAMPGVLAVLTGRDAAADGLASIPHKPVPTNPNEFPLGGRDGGHVLVTPHPPLANDTVRFAGEAVAMVIAETAAAAADAAEAVRVV